MASSASAATSSASPQTMRRLMKEFETIRSELQAREEGQLAQSDVIGQQSENSSSSSSSITASQKVTSPPSAAKAAANPDLLELRPWDADGEDLFEWYAVIKGPDGGNYEGGTFELSINIPPTYPSKPPQIRFKTKLWHPNVSWKNGEICLDVLASQWSPAWQLSSACTAIIALLDAPEPDSPLNVDAATVFRTGDSVAYQSMCRMYTLLYAVPYGAEESK